MVLSVNCSPLFCQASLAKYSGTVERLGFDENFVDVSEMVRIPPWTEVSSTPEGFVYQKCEIREAASMTSRFVQDQGWFFVFAKILHLFLA